MITMTGLRDEHSKTPVIKGFEILDIIQFRDRLVFDKQRTVESIISVSPFLLCSFNICLNIRGQTLKIKIFIFEQKQP